MNKIISEHHFTFNPKDNGGESLTLSTEFIDNGDDGEEGIYTNHKLTLHSYCNAAHFELCGISITPELLRELANQLENAKQIAIITKRTDDLLSKGVK